MWSSATQPSCWGYRQSSQFLFDSKAKESKRQRRQYSKNRTLIQIKTTGFFFLLPQLNWTNVSTKYGTHFGRNKYKDTL